MKRLRSGVEVQWLKKGGGTFRMKGGRQIKPGEKFWATPEEVPAAFRDTITVVETADEATPNNPKEGYELQQRSPGWYNVVDKDGNMVNQSAMRKKDAEKYMEDL